MFTTQARNFQVSFRTVVVEGRNPSQNIRHFEILLSIPRRYFFHESTLQYSWLQRSQPKPKWHFIHLTGNSWSPTSSLRPFNPFVPLPLFTQISTLLEKFHGRKKSGVTCGIKEMESSISEMIINWKKPSECKKHSRSLRWPKRKVTLPLKGKDRLPTSHFQGIC